MLNFQYSLCRRGCFPDPHWQPSAAASLSLLMRAEGPGVGDTSGSRSLNHGVWWDSSLLAFLLTCVLFYSCFKSTPPSNTTLKTWSPPRWLSVPFYSQHANPCLAKQETSFDLKTFGSPWRPLSFPWKWGFWAGSLHDSEKAVPLLWGNTVLLTHSGTCVWGLHPHCHS